MRHCLPKLQIPNIGILFNIPIISCRIIPVPTRSPRPGVAYRKGPTAWVMASLVNERGGIIEGDGEEGSCDGGAFGLERVKRLAAAKGRDILGKPVGFRGGFGDPLDVP